MEIDNNFDAGTGIPKQIPIPTDMDGILFSHHVMYKKIEGILQVFALQITFIPCEQTNNNNNNAIMKIEWKDILKDQYSTGEQTPMIRLTLHSTTQPVIFKFIHSSSSSSSNNNNDGNENNENDNNINSKQSLRDKLDKLKKIIKENYKLHNINLSTDPNTTTTIISNTSNNTNETKANTITNTNHNILMNDKLNKLKLRILEENLVLKRRYTSYVLDPNNNILSDEEFWYNINSNNNNNKSVNSYGYDSLDSYIANSNDSELKVYWYSLINNNQNNLTLRKPILSKGKLSSLLSDKCFYADPLTNEVKISLNPEVTERIFLMCK